MAEQQTVQAGASLYVHVGHSNTEVVGTDEVAAGVLIDKDAGGNVVGVEVWEATSVEADGIPLALPSTPDRSMVDTIRQALHDVRHGCAEEPGGHQRLAEEIARRLTASTPDGDVVKAVARALWGATYIYQHREFDKLLADGEPLPFEAQARAAVLALFESPEWRRVAKAASDCAMQDHRGAAERERAVYRERAQLVAVLAHFYPSVWAYSDPAEPEWPVVYVDTPQGQCSWHLHRDDLGLFGHVPQVPAEDPRARWDGHSTEEKYKRLAELAADGPATDHGDGADKLLRTAAAALTGPAYGPASLHKARLAVPAVLRELAVQATAAKAYPRTKGMCPNEVQHWRNVASWLTGLRAEVEEGGQHG